MIWFKHKITFWNLSLQMFAAGKTSPFLLKTYFAFALVQLQNSDKKKVIFEVFVIWRYPKTLKSCTHLFLCNKWEISEYAKWFAVQNMLEYGSKSRRILAYFMRWGRSLSLCIKMEVEVKRKLLQKISSINQN